MKAKHTPVEWKASGNGVHAGIDCVATTHWPDQEQRHAHARLIAAAPDLLAACKALIETVKQYAPQHEPGHICGPESNCDGFCMEVHNLNKELEMARAVIAKAEAEE